MFRRSFTYSSKKARCVPWERAPLWRDLPSCWIHICVTWRLVGLTLNKIFLCKLHPFLVLCLLCFRLSMQCPVLCRCHAIGTEMSAFRCFLSPYRTFSHMHSISPPSPTPSFTEQGVLSPSIFRLILKKTYSQMTVSVWMSCKSCLISCIHASRTDGIWCPLTSHRASDGWVSAAASAALLMWKNVACQASHHQRSNHTAPSPLAKRIILTWQIMLGTLTSLFSFLNI